MMYNNYFIVVATTDPDYMHEERIFRSNEKEKAMIWFVNWESLGAKPTIKLIWQFDEDGNENHAYAVTAAIRQDMEVVS